MSDLCKNAIDFLKKRYPSSSISNKEKILKDWEHNEAFKIWEDLRDVHK